MLGATACGGEPTVDAGMGSDASASARLELGEGTSRFEPLTEGQDVELIAGVQGGFHINLTGRLYGLELDGITLEYEAVPVGASEPISMPTELVLDATDFVPDQGSSLRAGDFLILAVDGPSEVVGMELEVSLTARDTEGHRASDSRRLRIVDEINELMPEG